jgi:LPS export ABC transporter protein LptC
MKRLKFALLIAILLIGGIVLARLWANLRERRASEAVENSARQYEEQNMMVLEDVKLTFYGKEGRIFYLTSKQGKIYQDSKNVDLTGDVVLTSNDGYQLKTQSASYDHSEKIVRTPDPVEIEGEQIRMTGKGMLVNVEAKTFRILSQVKTHLTGKKKV